MAPVHDKRCSTNIGWRGDTSTHGVARTCIQPRRHTRHQLSGKHIVTSGHVRRLTHCCSMFTLTTRHGGCRALGRRSCVAASRVSHRRGRGSLRLNLVYLLHLHLGGNSGGFLRGAWARLTIHVSSERGPLCVDACAIALSREALRSRCLQWGLRCSPFCTCVDPMWFWSHV